MKVFQDDEEKSPFQVGISSFPNDLLHSEAFMQSQLAPDYSRASRLDITEDDVLAYY